MLKIPFDKKKILFLIIAAVILIGGAITFYKFHINKDIQLRVEEKTGSINVLLLGKAGGLHEGPNLTDTIILVTINPDGNIVNLVSIPRDLWVKDLQAKINTAYAYGEERDNQGKLLAKSAVEQITGRQIDYILVIDFSGFVSIVDHLGGIEVDVKRSFDDYQYPIEGKQDDPCGYNEEEIINLSSQIATGSAKETDAFPCRYKHVRFDSGVQLMNGETALEFVRSRHGINGEGSDFARSQRQQQVITAIKNKVFSLGTILNPIKVVGIFNILKDNIDTNAQVHEVDDFINLAQKMESAKIVSTVIDFGDEQQERSGLLIHPPITEAQKFQWVLIPRRGDGEYSEIHDYIKCIEEGVICEILDDGIVRLTPTLGTSK